MRTTILFLILLIFFSNQSAQADLYETPELEQRNKEMQALLLDYIDNYKEETIHYKQEDD